MAENLIEFHARPGTDPPRPYPASQGVPPWLKQMASEASIGANDRLWPTLKKCPPFVDALTGGYLIPLAADVEFVREADGVSFRSDLPVIETHPQEQILGSVFAGKPVVKFINLWIIKTPPDYSCLFVQPLNRVDLPFHVFSGIVETDTYYREVHFPSICLMRPGTRTLVRKGTPLVQVFPFKRESWTCGYGTTDVDRSEAVAKDIAGTMGYYKEHYWARKKFD